MYKCCFSSADACINVMGFSPFSIWKKIACPAIHAFIKDSVWPVHEITDNSCVKGPQKVSSPASSSKQGQLRGQANLLRTSKSGSSIPSLGSPLHCWAFLTGKRFLCGTSPNLSALKLHLLPPICPPCTTKSSLDLSSLWSCSRGRLGSSPPPPPAPSHAFSRLKKPSSLSLPSQGKSSRHGALGGLR